MNLLEAIRFLRTNILDDIGGLGADWESFSDTDSDSLQLRWTNEELASNINEAIIQVYRRILPVKEVNPKYSITTQVGVQEYEINPRILQIVGIRNSTDGKTLERIDIQRVWDDTSLTTKSGEPICYIPNYDNNTIIFYRIPDSIQTYNLLTYRLPLKDLDWENNEDDIELREEFIVPMLDYAAHLCYNKDEANVLDPSRSIMFLQKFNQEFPSTSAYSDTRKRYTSNRSTKYGGL